MRRRRLFEMSTNGTVPYAHNTQRQGICRIRIRVNSLSDPDPGTVASFCRFQVAAEAFVLGVARSTWELFGGSFEGFASSTILFGCPWFSWWICGSAWGLKGPLLIFSLSKKVSVPTYWFIRFQMSKDRSFPNCRILIFS